MRFAHFFVDRPIFASVTSIIFLILGYVAYLALPVAQYPEIVPPTVTVRASFPGANAETVAATIASAWSVSDTPSWFGNRTATTLAPADSSSGTSRCQIQASPPAPGTRT